MERPCRAGDRLILIGRPRSMSTPLTHLLGSQPTPPTALHQYAAGDLWRFDEGSAGLAFGRDGCGAGRVDLDSGHSTTAAGAGPARWHTGRAEFRTPTPSWSTPPSWTDHSRRCAVGSMASGCPSRHCSAPGIAASLSSCPASISDEAVATIGRTGRLSFHPVVGLAAPDAVAGVADADGSVVLPDDDGVLIQLGPPGPKART